MVCIIVYPKPPLHPENNDGEDGRFFFVFVLSFKSQCSLSSKNATDGKTQLLKNLLVACRRVVLTDHA